MQIRMGSLRQALARVEGDLKAAEAAAERVAVVEACRTLGQQSDDLAEAISRLPEASAPLREHIEALAVLSGRYRQERQRVSQEATRLQLPLPRLLDSGEGWNALQRLLGDLQRAYGEALREGER